ncbi:MAG: hypothetical protein A2132_05710 [Nitrospirae bacterium RBG_16_43_11]|nr:MAG: hypothetical protein A2132_05710 [Nitrospirae bacterium RBG_16_43_11]
MGDGEGKGGVVIRRILITMLAFVSITCTAYASDTDWRVHIRVSVPDSKGADGTVWNHLIAGVRQEATDGFDGEWDTLAMVETDDPVQSMFIHGTAPEDKNDDGMIDGWACHYPDTGYGRYHCSLWRDIRSLGTTQVWQFPVLSTLNHGTVEVTWSFEGKPENLNISLVDLSDTSLSLDMLTTNRYSYTNVFESGKKYGIHYFELRMDVAGLTILPFTLPDATIGTPYNARLSAAGGNPWWSIEDGTPIPWLNTDPLTGDISGIPMETGTYIFTVRGDDPVIGYSISREYQIDINPMPKIDTLSLPDGITGRAYNTQLSVAGGSEPLRWDIKGNMPEGLSLDQKRGIISGVLIVPGIYDFKIIVKDINDASDSVTFRITVVEPEDTKPPEAIKDLRVYYLTDTSLLFTWTAPFDNSLTRTSAKYDLRYMEGCTDPSGLDWDKSAEADSEPRPQAGVLHTYTLTGLSPDKPYCVAIKSMDAGGYISPVSNIVTSPLLSQNGLSGFVESASSMKLMKGYNLISFPLMPVPNGRDSLIPVLGDNVALYRWYSYYPGITPPQYYLEDVILPGFGYLLYSYADNIALSINGLLMEGAEHKVVLQEGWSMIGTPYNQSVLLKDILVKNKTTGEIRPYNEAVRGGWIGNTIYNLKASNYDFASFNDDPPAALEPWAGYWIYAGSEDGVELIFRRP